MQTRVWSAPELLRIVHSIAFRYGPGRFRRSFPDYLEEPEAVGADFSIRGPCFHGFRRTIVLTERNRYEGNDPAERATVESLRTELSTRTISNTFRLRCLRYL